MKLCFDCARIIEYGDVFCPYCGADTQHNSAPKEAYHLAPGTKLKDNRYVICRAIGYGGFGVTYAAFDALLERRVAIKEFMPSDLSTRTPGTTIVNVFGGEENEANYIKGLQSFMDESERLAKFNEIDGIVTILDCFFENNTAYMVMELLDGRTAKALLDEKGRLSYEETLKIMLPVLDALEQVHSKGIIHRDISPDNIFLTDDGKVKLLDFGAARYAAANASKSLSVILKPGYAPTEQYRTRGSQGAWTDVYACGATMYKLLTGVTPEESLERAANDSLKPLSKMGVKISKNAETAIMNALVLDPNYRTRSAGEFKSQLLSDTPVMEIVPPKEKKPWSLPKWVYGALAGVLLLGGVFAALMLAGVIRFGGRAGIDKDVFSERISVPNIIGMTEEETAERYSDWNLIMIGSAETDAVPVGCIMQQSPEFGSAVSLNEKTVQVVVNRGAAVEENIMPYLRGTSLEEAQSILSDYTVSVVSAYDGTVEAGKVSLTEPDYNTPVTKGQEIKLVVSRGGLLEDIELPMGDEITVNIENDPIPVDDLYNILPVNVDPSKVNVEVKLERGEEYASIQDGYLVLDSDIRERWTAEIGIKADMVNEDTGETVSVNKTVTVICIRKQKITEEPTVTAAPTPKPTSRPAAPSNTPRNTRTPRPATPTPKPTNTPRPTNTPKPTATPTPMLTATPTTPLTPKPTAAMTPFPPPTPKPTATPTPAMTPKPTPVLTPYPPPANPTARP